MRKSTLFLLTLVAAVGLLSATVWAMGALGFRSASPSVYAAPAGDVPLTRQSWAGDHQTTHGVGAQGASTGFDGLTFGSTYVGGLDGDGVYLPLVARSYQGWFSVMVIVV